VRKKLGGSSKVTSAVASDFLYPARTIDWVRKLIGDGIEAPFAPLATVPELTVNKNCQALLPNGDIWPPRQVMTISVETNARRTQRLDQRPFRCRPGGTDSPH